MDSALCVRKKKMHMHPGWWTVHSVLQKKKNAQAPRWWTVNWVWKREKINAHTQVMDSALSLATSPGCVHWFFFLNSPPHYSFLLEAEFWPNTALFVCNTTHTDTHKHRPRPRPRHTDTQTHKRIHTSGSRQSTAFITLSWCGWERSNLFFFK